MNHIERFEQEVSLPFIQPSWKYYEIAIPRGSTVVSVGAGMTPYHDLSTVSAAWFAGTEGRVYIADPSGLFSESPRSGEKGHVRVRGKGAALTYISYMDILREHGVALAPTEWLGEMSGVHQFTGISNGSARVVIDHSTVSYVMERPGFEGTGFRRKILKQFLAESYRVLKKPDGVLLLQTNARNYGFDRERFKTDDDDYIRLKHAMRKAGFRSVMRVKVDDRFVVPVTVESAEALRDYSRTNGDGNGVLQILLGDMFFTSFEQGGMCIDLPARDTGYANTYISPDLFIGVT